MNKRVKFITQSAAIAAIYIVLTVFISAFGLANGAIQIRLSEALTILPYFSLSALPGLFIGCLISNLITGCAIWDVVFGSIATLIGAVFTYLLKNKSKYLAPIAPILSNSIIIPFVLIYVYGIKDAWWFLFLTVGIGEVISCGVLGIMLLNIIEKNKNLIFK
ncbi:MAG: QueT transporter family protein [Ruminococcaceae bacterium]|nr:QueT transporter family protein [Oscillospiraceae bacterium]